MQERYGVKEAQEGQFQKSITKPMSKPVPALPLNNRNYASREQEDEDDEEDILAKVHMTL